MTDRRQIGDRVRTRCFDPSGHTRLPRYIRGREGTVVAFHGDHRLPDRVAAGLPTDPQPVYAVRFRASDLWGSGSHSVTIELWDAYLEDR